MQVMKSFTIALVASALAALPAHGQVAGSGKRPHEKSEKKVEKKPEVDENAYKAALERIPEPKEKYDPWSGARPAEPAKKK